MLTRGYGVAPAGPGDFLKTHRQRLARESVELGPFPRHPLRVGKPVTQEEMAEALEVSRQWYAMLEADTARASPALVSRIGAVLSLNADERHELFGLAIPEFAAPSAPERPRLLDALSAQTAGALEHAIGSTADIEMTARRLDRLRERFLSSGEIEQAALRPRVVRSWLRSRSNNVDAAQKAAPFLFARDVEIRELREQNELLLRAARPVMRYLADQFSGTGYAVILVDRNGYVLELEGDHDIRQMLAKLELQPGGAWSENAAGTNAIGTALADRRPLQLLGSEHYCDGWKTLTCTAAPVRDPYSLDVIGVLDITGSYKLIRAHLLALIMQCALTIEEALERLTSGISVASIDSRP
jgi:transcriptional regulator with XRE-family HTH domain